MVKINKIRKLVMLCVLGCGAFPDSRGSFDTGGNTPGGQYTWEYEGSGTNLQATLSSDQRLEVNAILGASSLSQPQQTAVQAAITNAFTQYGDYVNFQPGSPAYNALVAAVAAQVGNTGGGGVSPAAIATALANYFQSQAWRTAVANYFAANPVQCGCDLPAFQAQLIEHIIAQLTEVPTGDEDDGNPIYNQLTQAVRDVAELALADSGIASDLYDTMDRVTALEGGSDAELVGDWSGLSTATTIAELTAAIDALLAAPALDVDDTTPEMPDNLVQALTELSAAWKLLDADTDTGVTYAANAATAIGSATGVQGDVNEAAFDDSTNYNPLEYLTGHEDGSYKKGLAEYGIFACEQAGYAGTTKITDTIGWGQSAIDSWLDGSGPWNNPPAGDKHVLKLYSMLNSSPVNAVRDHAADIPGWYDDVRRYYVANQHSKAKTAAIALADAIILSLNEMVASGSFVLPTAITNLFSNIPSEPNSKQLREIFLQAGTIMAGIEWGSDVSIALNRTAWEI